MKLKKFRSASLLAILVGIITLTGASFSWAAESVLNPSDDVYGMQQNPGTVKNETELMVKSHTGEKNKRSFLKFDLSTIPDGCVIDGASLELFLLSAPGSNRVHELYFVASDAWAETTLTWNNQPAFSGFLAQAETGSTNNATITWSANALKNQVATEYAADNKISLLIKDALENNNERGAQEGSYASKEHETSPKPVLRVSYTCANQQGCSHGFWKNHVALWPTGYSPANTLYQDFDYIPEALVTDTFETALGYGGGPDEVGAAKILLRNAVAALLNAAALGNAFGLTEEEVRTRVSEALATGNRKTILDLEIELDTLNNLGCPLG
jgi:hypothetical protein